MMRISHSPHSATAAWAPFRSHLQFRSLVEKFLWESNLVKNCDPPHANAASHPASWASTSRTASSTRQLEMTVSACSDEETRLCTERQDGEETPRILLQQSLHSRLGCNGLLQQEPWCCRAFARNKGSDWKSWWLRSQQPPLLHQQATHHGLCYAQRSALQPRPGRLFCPAERTMPLSCHVRASSCKARDRRCCNFSAACGWGGRGNSRHDVWSAVNLGGSLRLLRCTSVHLLILHAHSRSLCEL